MASTKDMGFSWAFVSLRRGKRSGARRQYPAVCDSSLLPLWEKVARTQSAPDEGSLSADTEFAETDPSPGCDATHRSHPLPQGERGRRRLRRCCRDTAVDHDGLAGHEA